MLKSSANEKLFRRIFSTRLLQTVLISLSQIRLLLAVFKLKKIYCGSLQKYHISMDKYKMIGNSLKL